VYSNVNVPAPAPVLLSSRLRGALRPTSPWQYPGLALNRDGRSEFLLGMSSLGYKRDERIGFLYDTCGYG